PLVFEFNAANATSLLLDCALSFTLYNSSRLANGTRLRLNSASESLSGDQFNNSSGYQYDDSGCSAELKFGHMNVKAIINATVINQCFVFMLYIPPSLYTILMKNHITTLPYSTLNHIKSYNYLNIE